MSAEEVVWNRRNKYLITMSYVLALLTLLSIIITFQVSYGNLMIINGDIIGVLGVELAVFLIPLLFSHVFYSIIVRVLPPLRTESTSNAIVGEYE